MLQLQLLFCSIVTNGTALQLCRDTSLSQELHYCSYAQVCVSRRPRWPGGHLPVQKNVYDGFLLMWCNVKFECALFRSDSRHNDRLDSLWGCAIKQAVLNSGIETKLLGGFWLLAKKCLRWIHAYVLFNISQQPENCENHNDPDLVQAFLKKWWALIEECSSIDTGEVKNNTAA